MGRGIRVTGAAVAVVMLLGACAASGARGNRSAGGARVVVVTTSILGDVVSHIAGDAAAVEVLMGPGVDPHAFEPSAAQARRVREADLVVANGLGLEPQLDDLLEQVEADGVPVLHVAEEVDPLPFALAAGEEDDHAEEGEDDHAEEGEDDGHGHGSLDPHFWFDPVRTAEAARLIGEELAGLDARGSDEDWRARADAYAAEVLAVHQEVGELLDGVPESRRRLVTNHDNLGYLAERYGYTIVGAVLPGGSTLAEASPADVAALAQLAIDAGVTAVFVETTASQRLADALAREIGQDVAVVTLFTDALGPPGSGADTYLGLMRTNARRVVDALGGSAT
ncbi:MAG: metal ABC transporter substrate-binding protein [Nitriliruptorales bacterium]